MTERIIQEILDTINREGSNHYPYIIAIDGRCGAGKSTLGVALAERLDANLIHMDDFFLRPEQRTEERLATPGENIDHERFLSEVLLPLKQGSSFSYSPFSCATQTLLPPVPVCVKSFAVIEGSYALHPSLRELYDFKVFLTIDRHLQEERIRRRNGDGLWPMFRDRWIPMEEAYFAALSVEKNADMVFESRDD